MPNGIHKLNRIILMYEMYLEEFAKFLKNVLTLENKCYDSAIKLFL